MGGGFVLCLDTWFLCKYGCTDFTVHVYLCKGNSLLPLFFSQWLLVALVEWSYGLKTSTVTLDLQPWPAPFSGVTVQLVETILCVCVCLGPVELASCRQMREKNNKYNNKIFGKLKINLPRQYKLLAKFYKYLSSSITEIVRPSVSTTILIDGEDFYDRCAPTDCHFIH